MPKNILVKNYGNTVQLLISFGVGQSVPNSSVFNSHLLRVISRFVRFTAPIDSQVHSGLNKF